MAASAQDTYMQDASVQDNAMQDNSIQDSSTQDKSMHDVSMSKHIEVPSTHIKGPGFLDLPAEFRNRIYKLLFSGTTIHLDGTAANPQNEYKLCITTCTAPLVDYLAVNKAKLAGTSNATLKGGNGKATVTHHYTEGKVCDSNQIFVADHICRQRVQLSTQLLSVCRHIRNEAALIPYATNAFVFSGGLHFHFRTSFNQKFTAAQRRGIRTAIVPDIFLDQVDKVPRLIPGVKHLWLEGHAWREDEDGDEETWVRFP